MCRTPLLLVILAQTCTLRLVCLAPPWVARESAARSRVILLQLQSQLLLLLGTLELQLPDGCSRRIFLGQQVQRQARRQQPRPNKQKTSHQ